MSGYTCPNVNALPSSGGGGMGKNPNANSKAKGGSAIKRSGKKGNRRVGQTKAKSGSRGSGYTN